MPFFASGIATPAQFLPPPIRSVPRLAPGIRPPIPGAPNAPAVPRQDGTVPLPGDPDFDIDTFLGSLLPGVRGTPWSRATPKTVPTLPYFPEQTPQGRPVAPGIPWGRVPRISGSDDQPENRPFIDPRVIPRNPKFNPDAGVPETHPCQEFKRNQKNRLEHNGQSLNSLLEAAKLMKERGDAARRNPGMSAQCLADLLALMAELERAARELRNLSTQNAWDIHDLENTYCVDLVNDRGATRRDGRRLEEMNAARSARIWELQVQLWDLQQRMNALLELCLGPPPVRRAAFSGRPDNTPLT